MSKEKQQQDKTEEATPKRRADARKKGDVPRSRELTMAGVTLTGAATLLLMSGPLAQRIGSGFARSFAIERSAIFDPAFMATAFGAAIGNAVAGLLPFMAVLLVAVFACAVLVGGWSFNLKTAGFKAERMSPAKGIKRIFSANSANELVKAIAKFALVATFAILWLWWSLDELLSLGGQPVRTAIPAAVRLGGLSLLVVSTSLVLIAAADVPFQLWNYRKKLRMTRTEVRDELKETEGRPEVRSRIRALQQQAATRRMMADVPKADVVVTNPEHYAVALKYDEGRMGAPCVVAKGMGHVAARIREIAADHGVPLFQAPPLARALYRRTDVGQEIPSGLYTAVAQVLAYIFQLKDTVSRNRQQLEPPVPDVDETRY